MNTIKVVFYIEGLGNDKKALENALEKTAEELKKESVVKVGKVIVEDIIENEEEELKYSGMIEAELEGSLEGIIKAVLKYAPAIVEVRGPGKLEIDSKTLMKILGEVSLVMGKLMDRFGGLAAYPSLDKLPLPKVGYSEEKLESFILDDRNIRYQFVIETFGEDEETIKETMLKALFLEGCKINKFVVKGEHKDDRYYALVATELISPFETMFQLNAKYAPVALAIIEPEIIDITATELQNALTDLAGFVYELIHRPLRKNLSKKVLK